MHSSPSLTREMLDGVVIFASTSPIAADADLATIVDEPHPAHEAAKEAADEPAEAHALVAAGDAAEETSDEAASATLCEATDDGSDDAAALGSDDDGADDAVAADDAARAAAAAATAAADARKAEADAVAKKKAAFHMIHTTFIDLAKRTVAEAAAKAAVKAAGGATGGAAGEAMGGVAHDAQTLDSTRPSQAGSGSDDDDDDAYGDDDRDGDRDGSRASPALRAEPPPPAETAAGSLAKRAREAPPREGGPGPSSAGRAHGGPAHARDAAEQRAPGKRPRTAEPQPRSGPLARLNLAFAARKREPARSDSEEPDDGSEGGPKARGSGAERAQAARDKPLRKREKKKQRGDRASKRVSERIEKAKKEYLGKTILKQFDKYGVFEGTIIDVQMFDTGLGYRVKYTDGDGEDMDEAEVKKWMITKTGSSAALGVGSIKS